MPELHRLLRSVAQVLPWLDKTMAPWQWLADLSALLAAQRRGAFPDDWIVDGESMIHRSAALEEGAILKGRSGSARAAGWPPMPTCAAA
ncbi:Uncharacterised protein [Chromobacterium violaceum]|uniref:Uncharacterized protein n=1 Tax=Chromobacterium violaceum TaxID=536 RepID=A0A3S4LJW9_CHRVL|nr:Uncharacterised protein [Chromobacterium violaceum]